MPAAAGAVELPGVPPGTLPPEVEGAIDTVLDSLPPEVSDAVDTAVADTFTQLVALDVPGVAQNSVTPGHASAAAVDIPGVITVGKSDSTKHTSSVNVLSVGGQDLLTRSGDAEGGTWTGQLAAAGAVLDGVNNALCPAGPAAAGNCITVLYAKATDKDARNHSASFHAARVQLEGAEEGITVLPTTATSNWFSVFGSDRCSDFATAFIATGTGTLALVALVGAGNAVSLSLVKPCPEPVAP
jgi:hypothetical protein